MIRNWSGRAAIAVTVLAIPGHAYGTPAAVPPTVVDADAGGEVLPIDTPGEACDLPSITFDPDDERFSELPCAALLPAVPVRPAGLNIFGFAAVPIGSGSVAAKWQAARGENSLSRGPWEEMLDQATVAPGSEVLETVNRWVNWHVRFQEDRSGDEWAAGARTLSRGYGDCEDLALAKLSLLEKLGVPTTDMFLVLVQERRRPMEHAVLAVRRGNDVYVLDSRQDSVRPAGETADYVPRFSFSGDFAWVYGRQLSVAPGRERVEESAAGARTPSD